MVLQSLKKMKKNKESNILYGSHNSMTYLPVKNWWLYPFNWIAKCQNKSIIDQYKAGARVFDLRVYLDTKTNIWGFAHGFVNFNTTSLSIVSIETICALLDKIALHDKEDIYIRLILEKYKNDKECERFKNLCEVLERIFTNIKFFGGNRKLDWKKLYTFKNDIPDNLNNQWVSSMAKDVRWYERICPRLYAKRMNKVNKEQMKEVVNLFDFI